MENPIYKWMMTGGTTILGNPHFNIEAMIVNVGWGPLAMRPCNLGHPLGEPHPGVHQLCNPTLPCKPLFFR